LLQQKSPANSHNGIEEQDGPMARWRGDNLAGMDTGMVGKMILIVEG